MNHLQTKDGILSHIHIHDERLRAIIKLRSVTLVVCVIYFAPTITDDEVSVFFNKSYEHVDYLRQYAIGSEQRTFK